MTKAQAIHYANLAIHQLEQFIYGLESSDGEKLDPKDDDFAWHIVQIAYKDDR